MWKSKHLAHETKQTISKIYINDGKQPIMTFACVKIFVCLSKNVSRKLLVPKVDSVPHVFSGGCHFGKTVKKVILYFHWIIFLSSLELTSSHVVWCSLSLCEMCAEKMFVAVLRWDKQGVELLHGLLDINELKCLSDNIENSMTEGPSIEI